jgi:preprotein translocase SecE subunit
MASKAPGAFLFSNVMKPMNYLRHVRAEFAHIVWPSTRTAVSHTLVVILIAAAITVLVGVLDYAFGGIVSRVVGF